MLNQAMTYKSILSYLGQHLYNDGALEFSGGLRVLLAPGADELIEMLRTEDGGISRQILKVVHDDGDEEIQK